MENILVFTADEYKRNLEVAKNLGIGEGEPTEYWDRMILEEMTELTNTAAKFASLKGEPNFRVLYTQFRYQITKETMIAFLEKYKLHYIIAEWEGMGPCQWLYEFRPIGVESKHICHLFKPLEFE